MGNPGQMQAVIQFFKLSQNRRRMATCCRPFTFALLACLAGALVFPATPHAKEALLCNVPAIPFAFSRARIIQNLNENLTGCLKWLGLTYS
jgi:hypothetical protein